MLHRLVCAACVTVLGPLRSDEALRLREQAEGWTRTRDGQALCPRCRRGRQERLVFESRRVGVN